MTATTDARALSQDHMRMLREFGVTRQEPGPIRRRWFASAGCDLVLWLDSDDSLWGFQFCYDKPANEHALTWVRGFGYSHMAIDSGERWGPGKAAPILVADGKFDPADILQTYRSEAQFVPEPYQRQVAEGLRALVENNPGVA